MLRLTPAAGAARLFTGIAAAAVLSAAAVLAVVHSGCENPGIYQPHNGVMELIGGCVAPEDLPIVPRPVLPPKPLGASPALTH